MIKSMTGFGRCEQSNDQWKFTVEMKSVNHRYLDVNIKIPKKLNFFENAIRNELKKYVERGKIDIYILYEDFTQDNVSVKYNQSVANAYFKSLQKMAKDFEIENDIKVSSLSRYPEVFTMEEQNIDEKELWKYLQEAIEGALKNVLETRVCEGENLQKDMMDKLDIMLEHIEFIKKRAPKVVETHKEKLENKVKELLNDRTIEENRILAEVVIFAEKICVDEEIVRLTSHIETMKDALNMGGAIGRKLDFIAQEMNREANTILSKSNDLETSNSAIELKTEIEKVREQIQNIE